MKKIGILTFHYSNNYGGVLQATALQKVIEKMGYEAEIINFIPTSYSPINKIRYIGILKRIVKNKFRKPEILFTIKKTSIVKKYSESIANKFDCFRAQEMNLSRQVNESSLLSVLKEYKVVVVGSDQIWNPSQRTRPEYFLNYADRLNVNRISYAADSTTKELAGEVLEILKPALERFDYISVRNEHSFDFVKTITGKEPDIVADPTILYDFKDEATQTERDYILAYVIGRAITGTHRKALEKIKEKYGDLPVYSIKVPDMKAESSDYADKVMYELGPTEWIGMFKNATFIYTDSYHGVLFSLKYHKPFLAYYTEALRATRFLDMGKRYGIEKYIVQNVDEIDPKGSVDGLPDFDKISILLNEQKKYSLKALEKNLLELTQ